VKTDELAGLVLPWAKEAKPEAYELTIKASVKPDTFRAYLIRLVELRAAEDVVWRNGLPLSVLEETGLTIQVRHRPSGQMFSVSGRKVPDRKFGFKLLTELEAGSVVFFLAVDDAFDLTTEPG